MANRRERELQEMQSRALRHPMTADTVAAPDGTVERRGNVFYRLSVIKDPHQFDGMPCWMVTAAVMDNTGQPLPYRTWAHRAGAIEFEMEGYLRKVGVPERQRTFHTASALCVVRQISGREWEKLDVATFHDVEFVDVQGGPVAILRETIEGNPGTRPCENPLRGDTPEPVDCGRCEPCLFRAAFESERAKWRRKNVERAENERLYAEFVQTPEGQAWLAQREAIRRAEEEGQP